MYGTLALDFVSFSHIPGSSPQAHQMLEMWASMSPPEPIDELNDQQASVIKNPKIAIAVLVENGYYGARNAGPIASLMIEKFLRGKITRTDLETKMLNTSLQGEYNKYFKTRVDSLLIPKTEESTEN